MERATATNITVPERPVWVGLEVMMPPWLMRSLRPV